MAMTFNAQGCADAATRLNTSAGSLEDILKSLKSNMTAIQSIYQSDAATELYSTYDNIEKKFPEFIAAIKDCSEYLVAMSNRYAEIEAAAKSKVQSQ